MELFTGFWNGEPAKYRVVNIVVGPEPKHLEDHAKKHSPHLKRYLWFVPFIGTTRQAVEVHYGGGDVFYLDNESGTGLRKVTEGMGSPQEGHFSVYPQPGIHAVPVHQGEWIKFFPALLDKINDDIDIGWRKIDAEGWEEQKERTKSLREAIRKNREKYPEAFKHLKK